MVFCRSLHSLVDGFSFIDHKELWTWWHFGKMLLSKSVVDFCYPLLNMLIPCIKAPHHSRASWMKFWRRHKHELNRTEGDEPLPVPPDKKMRYSKEDDVLLARYFFNKPDGTSDKIFQAFGRSVCAFFARSCTLLPKLCYSIHITRGRAGKSIIGYIKPKLNT